MSRARRASRAGLGRPRLLRDPEGGLADILLRLKDAVRDDRIT